MKYYAVIDTNVLVSAVLKWDSVPGKIIALVFDERIVPVLNTEIVKEYRVVLMRPKFHLTEDISKNREFILTLIIILNWDFRIQKMKSLTK